MGPADEWTEHRPEQVWDNVLKGSIGFIYSCNKYIFYSDVLIYFVTSCNVGPADEWTKYRPEQVWDNVLQGVIVFIYSCSNYIFYSDVLIYFVTCCNVRPADEWTEHWPQQVWDNVLKGVGVEGGEGHRGSPFVVLLVDVLVDLKWKEKLLFCYLN